MTNKTEILIIGGGIVGLTLAHQLLKRNSNLPPTKAVEITNMVGCSAIK